ncbi:MAG: MEDS domain-containing protein [Chloroflexi bacterium]|nr:MEDS domain-containing protein [Chloroflexota bacterium]
MIGLRKSGIGAVGDVAWGTHFCQFYHTREDLVDILVPDFYRLYQGKGQIEMVPYSVWYLKDGSFDLSGLLSGRVHKATQALSKGYDGVRVTVNVAWPDKKTWNNFVSYEEE